MAIEHGYATLAEAKARLDIRGANDDARIEQMIEAASREIDGWCGRTFFTVTESRYVDSEWPLALFLPFDLVSLTTVATDDNRDRTYGTTWGATDWELGDGPPYRALHATPNGTRSFPLGRRMVRLTGTWGYASDVPHAVREACLVQVARLFKRSDAPFGIAGSADHGQLQTLPGMDPDVKQLLKPYRQFGLVGV